MNPSILIFLVVGVIITAYIVWYLPKSRSMLRQWASTNGYQILHAESRSFRRGPWSWNSSKNQAVFLVKVRDAAGRERSAWVCCGDYRIGLFSDTITVKWDDENRV